MKQTHEQLRLRRKRYIEDEDRKAGEGGVGVIRTEEEKPTYSRYSFYYNLYSFLWLLLRLLYLL